MEANRVVGNLQPDRRGFSCCAAALRLRRIDAATLARVVGRTMLRHRQVTFAFQFVLRAEAGVSLALAHQPLRMLAIEVEPIALPVGNMRTTDIRSFVPVNAQPLQVFEELRFVAAFTALQVGVLDAQDHGAASLARKEPVIQGGSGIADMQLSGGRRGETYANFRGRAHSLMVANAGLRGAIAPASHPISPITAGLLFRLP